MCCRYDIIRSAVSAARAGDVAAAESDAAGAGDDAHIPFSSHIMASSASFFRGPWSSLLLLSFMVRGIDCWLLGNAPRGLRLSATGRDCVCVVFLGQLPKARISKFFSPNNFASFCWRKKQKIMEEEVHTIHIECTRNELEGERPMRKSKEAKHKTQSFVVLTERMYGQSDIAANTKGPRQCGTTVSSTIDLRKIPGFLTFYF